MIRFIIVALMLATVWGCSDDRTGHLVKNDFPIIEGMELSSRGGFLIGKVGDTNKLDMNCPGTEKGFGAFPNCADDEFILSCNVKNAGKVLIYIETANTTQEFKDSLEQKYKVSLVDHKEYYTQILLSEFREQDFHSIKYNVSDFDAGAYIILVERAGVEDVCIPFIVVQEKIETD
jgi:hypothetical protein